MGETILRLTARIVASYAGNNPLTSDQVQWLIKAVHHTLSAVDTAPSVEAKPEPAVEVKKSVFGDHLLCLACGASYKTLKRHLGNEHNLTPEQYRTRYGLPRTYPIVAPDYAKARSALAKKTGLGRGSRGRPPRKAGRGRG